MAPVGVEDDDESGAVVAAAVVAVGGVLVVAVEVGTATRSTASSNVGSRARREGLLSTVSGKAIHTLSRGGFCDVKVQNESHDTVLLRTDDSTWMRVPALKNVTPLFVVKQKSATKAHAHTHTHTHTYIHTYTHTWSRNKKRKCKQDVKGNERKDSSKGRNDNGCSFQTLCTTQHNTHTVLEWNGVKVDG